MIKLAIFHNLPSGGAKRVLFENIRGLKNLFNFDLFDIPGPYDNFADIRLLCREVFSFSFKETPLLPKPFGFLNSFCRIFDLYRLNNLEKNIAGAIDKRQYSLVFVYADRFSQTPFLLRHLRTKSLYYCHDPYIRSIYEPEIFRKTPVIGFKNKLKKILYFPGEYLYKVLLAKFDKENTAKATKIIICSKFSADMMKKLYGFSPDTVYPGVNTKIFSPSEGKKENSVISQGSILYRKGHHFIIESLGNIEKNLRPELIILSDSQNDTEKNILDNLASFYKVNIRYYQGITDIKEVVCVYQKALICLCGQIQEPFPLSVLEASSCQVPVIAVSEGGMKESVIDGKTGYLTKRDPKIFAEKIKKLLIDRKLREKLGLQARQIMVKNYDWSVVNQRLKTVILNLLAKN